MADTSLPRTQHAVELVGPGRLEWRKDKPVPQPGPRQILLRVEAVGLCFSDMKLLKQFADHPRKAGVVAGLPGQVLKEIPSYVPGGSPTVPGHEVSAVVAAVGDEVKDYALGQRFLVQPDFRALKTPGSNGAFGYNFEGALQEYVLVDERVLKAGAEPYLIPADPGLARAQVALVEPWACVENSYRTSERQSLLPLGRLLVVGWNKEQFEHVRSLYPAGKGPSFGNMFQFGDLDRLKRILADRPEEFYDDIIVYGAQPEILELLNTKLAARGIFNVVLQGERLERKVTIGLGRVHYGYTRWIGTTGSDPGESYASIPANGEFRGGDRVLVVGAGGPMGQMHAIRGLTMGLDVTAGDIDRARLSALAAKAPPDRTLHTVDLSAEPAGGPYDYVALMAPLPALVEQAIEWAAPGGLVNVFAGIPAPVVHPIDMQSLIEKRLFVFGTSGSEAADMIAVYDKLVGRSLDTNLSVDAVSGMAGALDGLRAVEERTLAGKIVVYPELADLPLTSLAELSNKYPSVAAKLDRGLWTREAEDELLRVAR